MSAFVNSFINEGVKEEEVETAQYNAKATKDNKKGAKVEIAGAATAKKSNSGMESLVVLLDHSLTFLPVEKLKVFTDIGAKSRDVSL